jgi:hypothetical protein
MTERIATGCRAASPSSLVRRLVLAQRDPVRRRVRRWLASIAEQRLSEFGLTAEDVAILRGEQASIGADHRPSADGTAGSSYPYEPGLTLMRGAPIGQRV